MALVSRSANVGIEYKLHLRRGNGKTDPQSLNQISLKSFPELVNI